uniref:Uncharacterized protein n=1 Tax=Lepeophtheirus salmonis TaxID=72036 RepID=A0A0K2TQG5_LEPSM
MGWRSVMRNSFTDSRERWLQYRLATSTVFTSKSKKDEMERLCSFCKDSTEASFRLFYEWSRVISVMVIVEQKIRDSLGIE